MHLVTVVPPCCKPSVGKVVCKLPTRGGEAEAIHIAGTKEGGTEAAIAAQARDLAGRGVDAVRIGTANFRVDLLRCNRR